MPEGESSWLSSFSPEERAKILLLDRQIFNKLGVSTATGESLAFLIGAGQKVALSRIVQPVINVTPDGLPVPSGMVAYKTVGGLWSLGPTHNASGILAVAACGSTGVSISQDAWGQGTLPYGSDGVGALLITASPNPMKHVSIAVVAAGDGSIAAANVLPAGGAGVKRIFYDVSLSGGVHPDQTSTLFGIMAFSDGMGYIGRHGHRLGPVKQATAATAITYSAVAGSFAANEALVLNVTYRDGA